MLCIDVYYNNIGASANEGKVKVYTEGGKIIKCEGNGTLSIGKNIKEISLVKYLKSGKVSVTKIKVDAFTGCEDIILLLMGHFIRQMATYEILELHQKLYKMAKLL